MPEEPRFDQTVGPVSSEPRGTIIPPRPKIGAEALRATPSAKEEERRRKKKAKKAKKKARERLMWEEPQATEFDEPEESPRTPVNVADQVNAPVVVQVDAPGYVVRDLGTTAITARTAPSDQVVVVHEPSVPRHTVAVTQAGNHVAMAVITELLRLGHRVIALDSDAKSVGLRRGDAHVVVPEPSAPTYRAEVVAAVDAERAEALIATSLDELVSLTAATRTLAELGCHTWLPDPVTVSTCLDRVEFARRMQEAGIAHPAMATNPTGAKHLAGPWVVTARQVDDGRPPEPIDDRRILMKRMRGDRNLVAHARLIGRPFSADILADRAGRLVSCVPRFAERIENGIALEEVTFRSELVESLARELVTALAVTGPAVVHGVLGDDLAVVVEVLPRFSETTGLAAAAGASLVAAYLRALFDPGRPIQPMRPVSGVRLYRYYAELVETPDDGDVISHGAFDLASSRVMSS